MIDRKIWSIKWELSDGHMLRKDHLTWEELKYHQLWLELHGIKYVTWKSGVNPNGDSTY